MSHPEPIPYSTVLDALEASGMKFKRVPPKEWVQHLRTGPQDPITNPAIKPLWFNEAQYGHSDGETTGTSQFHLLLDKTLAASQELQDTPVVDKDLIEKFVQRWMDSNGIFDIASGFRRYWIG